MFGTIEVTGEKLTRGFFRAKSFPVRRLSQSVYAKAYGYFKAPSTIALDEDLPRAGIRFSQPGVGTTASYYCAVHEVIHADDYTDKNRLVTETLKHIGRGHSDELDEAERILERHSRERWRRSRRKSGLINTWTYQYVDSATHYRSYLVLKHHQFPKIDNVWLSLYNSIFSPRLFTTIEREKGLHYTANLLTEQVGEKCIVEIAREYEEISQRRVESYTV